MAPPQDQSPFLCAYLLDGRGGGNAIEEGQVRAWAPEQGLLWVHLDVLSERAGLWLLKEGRVDPIVAEALMAVETRPRAALQDAGLLVTLRGVNTNPGSDPDDMVAIRLWIEKSRIISSRRRRLLSIQDLRDSIGAGTAPTSSGGFLVSLVERLADRIGNVVNDIEEQIEAAEDRVALVKGDVLRAELSAQRRQTAAIRRYLAPQRDALDRLYRQPGALFSDTEAYELREQSDRITRFLEDLDLARERAIVLQEELLSRMAHEQNSRVYLLSVVAAVFLPLTFVTGLLGMNVAGMPGADNPLGFVFSVALMLSLGAALALFFKWKKWI